MPCSCNQDPRNPQNRCCCNDSNQNQGPERERTFDPILFSMLILTAVLLGNVILSEKPQVIKPANAVTQTNTNSP